MASQSSPDSALREEARRLGEALDAAEAALDAAAERDLDAAAEALAGPVRALGAAAKEA